MCSAAEWHRGISDSHLIKKSDAGSKAGLMCIGHVVSSCTDADDADVDDVHAHAERYMHMQSAMASFTPNTSKQYRFWNSRLPQSKNVAYVNAILLLKRQ
jgi:hypothetical protein